MNFAEKELKLNAASNRLELELDGNIAFIDYKLSHEKLFLIHTEVPTGLAFKGAGSAIVEKALQYAKQNHFQVVPICPFVQAFLLKHPGWNEIVSPDSEKFIHP